MKRKLKIAVRSLIEQVLRSGDLELEFTGSSRSVEAIRAHQKIQNSRPENYTPEVPVNYQIESDQFILEIGGRIDGVYAGADRVIIDEIKTSTRDLDYFEKEENPWHWGQVKTYAYIYAIEHGMDEIDIQLTYFQLDTGEMRELNRSVTTGELEKFFNKIVACYLEWAENIANWCRLRDESILNLEFPFAGFRQGQRKMAVDVFRAIKNKEQVIVQAATGIGKTMAAIFPAVKAIPEELNSKIFYLTARTTAQAAAEKAFDELRHKGLRIKSLTLTAKDKICPFPENTCNVEECKFARGYYDRVDEARTRIFNQDAFTRIVIEQTAEAFMVCPFEFSLELALWADCIICDYNYAFDPRVYLRRFFLEEIGEYTFLIDEAHNLVDRSREMFSAEIRKQPFLDIRRALKHELPQVYKSMGKINSWLVKEKIKCANSETLQSEKEPPNDLFPLLKSFLKITERWLTLNIKTPFREGLLELYFNVTGFMRVGEQYDETYATCFEQIKKDFRLKLFCIDPAGQMKEALGRCNTAVFFSATLTPADYFKHILGCRPSGKKLSIPTPFPDKNLGVLIADRVSTLYRHREKTKPQVSLVIISFVTQKKGNYLLFFPSYKYMMMIHTLFEANSPETETIVQTPGMTESEREAFLKRFAKENPETLAGFAVMGGIFGEGIDLVGDRLSGVAIVGVGLPGISIERELVREYFKENNGAGFEYAYLYPGINRVLQAAGRVIRSENDRGVILLIDQRFSTFRYKSLFPEKWRPIMIKNEAYLGKELKKFWDKIS